MDTLETFIETHGSQDRAARALGVSQGFLCRVLQGKRALSLSQALRFEAEHSVNARGFISEDAQRLLRNPNSGRFNPIDEAKSPATEGAA